MSSPPNGRIRVATVGAAYSANKGAGSMIQALVDHLDQAEIDVHSTYPIADGLALQSDANVTVVAAPPKRTALLDFPLAAVAGALRRMHIPWRWICRTPALRSFSRTDVVADVTGISFSDARPTVFAPYHFLLDIIPMMLGVPVVKCSQAIGPFGSAPVRLLSSFTLPRLKSIVARGPRTSELLAEIGIDHVEAHDLAFAMKLTDHHREVAKGLLADIDVDGPFIAVAPSTLVQQKSEAAGVDYAKLLGDVIADVTSKTGLPAVLLAHSSQPSEPADAEQIPNRLNDLVVCRVVADLLDTDSNVKFLDLDLSPMVLRAVISEAEIVLTSRFHAMISALSVGTPPLVIGWSHKYGEVLTTFGIDDNVIDYTIADADAISEATITQIANSEQTQRQIFDALPAVTASAKSNIDVLLAASS